MHDNADDIAGIAEEDEGDRNLLSLWEIDEDTDVVVECASFNPAVCPTSAAPDKRIAPVIGIFQNRGILCNAAEKLANDTIVEWPTSDLPRIDLFKKWVKYADTDNALAPNVPTPILSRDTEVVELLENALLESNLEWQPLEILSHSPTLIRNFASVSDTSRS
ncbi:hypothetical protein PC116_g13002 [Phytophthora cactorum]|uniref:Uncharacterized protein n=1 Tax=Phytophthora cactorum TaxID=29920 RepID=A0A8T1CJA2_9STRA|nr:hypothetical protein PC112_g9536 [Phytophthora cactorum]KAG2827995.1 hypothetical protein PC111_g8357 [Phytophthora cactorum]KAG2858449.1 hypothetical protein PC113_g9817 [Phytophthora cactorum]KAG2908344.1 hypothetical protein PC114_g10505 [Phytophthora cactorum]KAG2924033.1 hypothetical protein PC115_g8765 [Phytophthora cactorum]